MFYIETNSNHFKMFKIILSDNFKTLPVNGTMITDVDVNVFKQLVHMFNTARSSVNQR